MKQPNNTTFTKVQYDMIYPDGIENHYWTKFRNKLLFQFIRKYGTSGKILEVGCGKGLVINYLIDHGIDACGVDLADVEPLITVKDKIWVNCDVKELPMEYCDQVETILLLDVIEHLPEPESFLQQLKKQFKRLKTMIITVPARKELFSNYDLFNEHFRRYDLEMLRQTVTGIQAKPVYMSYLYHILYLPTRMILLFWGKRAIAVKPPKGIMLGVHAIIARCLFLDYLFFPKKWKGTSIISVIQIN